MYNSIKKSLLKTTSAKSDQPFVQAASNLGQVSQSVYQKHATLSGNGALKYSSTNDPFVDQFGTMGTFKKPRTFQQISEDCEKLYASDRVSAIKFIFFLRTITRKVSLEKGKSTQESQKGGELRYEAIMRMLWLYNKEPKVFKDNLILFVLLGSWKDIISMLKYDLMYHGWEGRVLDWEFMGGFILSALQIDSQTNLVKKYLPSIRATSKCKTVESQADTMIGKWITSLLFGKKSDNAGGYKMYRKLKSSGTAHEWQKLISQSRFAELDIKSIHGRALSILMKSGFFHKKGLADKLTQFVKTSETIKYTGFVHELFENLSNDKTLLEAIDKQFMELIRKAGESQTNSIVVIDTSGSMTSKAHGTKTSSLNIAKGLALYFSYFLKGKFQNSFIEFASSSIMRGWTGNSPTQKWKNFTATGMGSTNFQSVIDLFVNLKTSGKVEESDFPTSIICVSDGEFNPSQLGKTNVDTAREKLRKAGFSQEYCQNFVIVLWNITNDFYGADRGAKFETMATEPGTYYFSGYSASVISFLTGGKILNAREVFDNAMNQEVLNLIQV